MDKLKFKYNVFEGSNVIEKEESLLKVLSKDDLYKPNGKNFYILTNTGVEKLYDFTKLEVKKLEVIIQPTQGNYQQHGVLIWVGYENEPENKWKITTGEASEFNTGEFQKETQTYKSFGHIDASYRLAMAEKRAKARALVKKIKLYGVYSEVEAPEFSNEEIQEATKNINNWLY